MRGITFIGMAGCGKSAMGKRIAPLLGWKFVDLDLLILEKQGISHHEYMKIHGEEGLKALEEKYTLELDLQNTIFAPPGSIIYSQKSMDKVKRESTVIYIQAPPEVIAQHLGDNLHKNGIIGLEEKGLAGVMAERTPLYEKYADLTFVSDIQTREEMVEKILQGLEGIGIKRKSP